MNAPRVIIIAGPNGAGKTTFAREFLPQEAGCPIFVNADLIAAGLSPFDPERAAIQAGRLTLQAASAHAGILGSWAAMRRAAQRARQVAQQTGTDLIVVRAGQVVRVAMSQKAKP